MFDIKVQNFSKAAEAGYTFELKLPTGEEAGATLTVIGDQSPAVKQYSRQQFMQWQQKNAIAKRKGRDPEELSLSEAEDLAVEGALVRLIGWEGITEGGKKVEFSKEKAREILAEHPWVREQIMQEASDVLNFPVKTSSK